MKIVCPKCQAAYEINVPESPQKDVSAKCAVCNNKFLIREKKTSRAHNSMQGPPLAQIESELNADPEDDLLFGLKNDVGELHRQNEKKSLEDENNLHDYLDRFLDDELGNGENPSFEPAAEQPAQKLLSPEEPSTLEIPSEEELDDLFQSIITEEIKSGNSPEEPADPASSLEADLETDEDDLDAFFDEVISDVDALEKGDKVIDGPEAVLETPGFTTEEDGGLDQELSDLLEGEESKTTASADPLMVEEVLFDQAHSKESAIDPADPKEDAIISSHDELDLAELAADEPRAETLAEQESLKETPEKETPPTVDDSQTTAEKNEPLPEPGDEKSDDDLSAETLAEQESLKETPEKETPPTVDDSQTTVEKNEPLPEPGDEKSDDDLWAEAFADQESLKETPEKETPPTVDDSQTTVEKNEPLPEPGDEKSDDEPQIEVLADPGDVGKDDSPEETPTDPDEEPEDGIASPESGDDDKENENEESEAEIEDPYDDDDDEEYSPPQKKKSGVFRIPATLTGKLVFGGSVLAVLLTGGGVYFALQTLAPPELTQMGKSESKIPDGLKPNPVGDAPAPSSKASESATTSTNPPKPRESAPAPIPGASPAAAKAPKIGEELKKAADPLKAAANPDVSEGLLASFAPSNHAVQLTTIMPVAYNVNDIRVLSLSLNAEFFDADSAQVVQEALPVFEKITTSTIEQLMDKKFFNDILYVREKLKKNLQTNFNKALEGEGRVKKINFTEFTIQ